MKIKSLLKKTGPYVLAALIGASALYNYEGIRNRVQYVQRTASVDDVHKELGEVVFDDTVLHFSAGFKSAESLEERLNDTMKHSRHFRRFLSETDLDRDKIITSREIDAYLKDRKSSEDKCLLLGRFCGIREYAENLKDKLSTFW